MLGKGFEFEFLLVKERILIWLCGFRNVFRERIWSFVFTMLSKLLRIISIPLSSVEITSGSGPFIVICKLQKIFWSEIELIGQISWYLIVLTFIDFLTFMLSLPSKAAWPSFKSLELNADYGQQVLLRYILIQVEFNCCLAFNQFLLLSLLEHFKISLS